MSSETVAPETRKVSKAGWKKAAVHTVTCPSGVVVDIRVPDLPRLVRAGHVPQHLLDVALEAAGEANENVKPSVEKILQNGEFSDILVQESVVEPKITEEDLGDIPYEDREFIVAIALRLREFDAEGNHIGGLDKSEKFRRFRGLGEFSSYVEGA